MKHNERKTCSGITGTILMALLLMTLVVILASCGAEGDDSLAGDGDEIWDDADDPSFGTVTGTAVYGDACSPQAGCAEPLICVNGTCNQQCTFVNSGSIRRIQNVGVQNGELLMMVSSPVPGAMPTSMAARVARTTPISMTESFSVFFTATLNPSRVFGITFFLHNDPHGIDGFSSDGEGLGFLMEGGPTPSVAVEFDTTADAGVSGSVPGHIAIDVDGVPTVPRVEAVPPFSLDGSTFNVWIDYTAEAPGVLKVYVGNTAASAKPTDPLITYSTNLAAKLGNTAYVGFSGASRTNAVFASIQRWLIQQNGVVPQCGGGVGLGYPVRRASECASLFAVEGVCCDQRCDRKCMSCMQQLTGTAPDGICAPIAVGTDPLGQCSAEPQSSCGQTGECDGKGECELFLGAPCDDGDPATSPDYCEAFACVGHDPSLDGLLDMDLSMGCNLKSGKSPLDWCNFSCWGTTNRHEWTAVQMSVGNSHICALKGNGAIKCTTNFVLNPSHPDWELAAEGPYKQVSAGVDRLTCALGVDNTVDCWNRTTPVSVGVPSDTFTSISVGDHACGVREDGTLDCWFGHPNPIPDGTFVAVASGLGYACAIRTDNTLACWGRTDKGQALPPSGTFVSVNAGVWTACGVRTDGSIACWGDQPNFAPEGNDYTTAAPGSMRACGRRTSGVVTCAGYDYGEWTLYPYGCQ